MRAGQKNYHGTDLTREMYVYVKSSTKFSKRAINLPTSKS